MKAHDARARFDGRFCWRSSTRIYCQPICRVRMPQQKNCTFHPVRAAAAEAAGPALPEVPSGTGTGVRGDRGEREAGAPQRA